MNLNAWNAKNPPGTVVHFWGGARMGPGRLSRTASEAYDTQNGPMVRIEGRAGGFLLTHVEPVEATEEDWHREDLLKHLDKLINELNRDRLEIDRRIQELIREKERIQKGEVPA